MRIYQALTCLCVGVTLLSLVPSELQAGTQRSKRKAEQTSRKRSKSEGESSSSSRSADIERLRKAVATQAQVISGLRAEVSALKARMVAFGAEHTKTHHSLDSIYEAVKSAGNRPLEYSVKSVDLGKVPEYLNQMGKSGWRLSHTEEYPVTGPNGVETKATRVYMERYKTSAPAKAKP